MTVAPTTPIVFLDFDGVLNDANYLYDERPGCLDADDWAEALNPLCVERLNRILAATGAKVVFSTSWRASGNDAWLKALLGRRGFIGEIAGRTSDLGERYLEIRMYVAKHDVTTWIAIDDGNMPELGEHMLLTSWAHGGLLEEHVTRAIAMLRGVP